MTFKSLEMEPNKDTPGTIFIKSQFTKPPRLPNDIDLSGKVAIVTGASTGLGFHACLQFLSFRLSHFIIAVRSVSQERRARCSKLHAQFPGAKIEVWELEMSSYQSIQAFFNKVEKELTRLDIVILNAGIVKQEFGVVKETDHEEVLQVK